MIYIALTLSALDTIWIITFTYFIHKLFKKLQPIMNSLTGPSIFDNMVIPRKDAEDNSAT